MFIEHDTNSLSLTLHGTEGNRRYQILSKTNLNEPLWHIEQEVTGALETNATLATVPMADRPDLFLWAISTPHNLRMALSSLYTHSGLLTASIEGGPASSIGFLVNSTNFAEATWIPYAEAVNIPLLNGDGDYEIWIGFVGAGAVTNWSMSRVVLDTVAPQIVITNPQPGTVSRPVIQFQGYSREPLSSISYDLVNDSGSWTNQDGFVTDEHFDTGTGVATTNWFQLFDVELAEGTNSITLRAEDLAGNVTVTNLQYVLDVSLNTNPPQVTLYWPLDGVKLSGSNVMIRGVLDDPPATIFAEIVSTNGTNAVEGIVERDGSFWITGLPLDEGNNAVSITSTNAAGHGSSTNLTVERSPVELTIDEPAAEDLIQPVLAWVTGTINTSGYSIWVNGVKATVSGNSWSAQNVPVNEGGTALIQVRAIPETDNNGDGTSSGSTGRPSSNNLGNPQSDDGATLELEKDKAAAIHIKSYDFEWIKRYTDEDPENSVEETFRKKTVHWTEMQQSHGSDAWEMEYQGHAECSTDYSWPEDFAVLASAWAFGANVHPQQFGEADSTCSGTNTAYAPTLAREICDVKASENDSNGTRTMSRTARTRMELRTNGKALAQQKNLFTIRADASRIGNPWYPDVSGDGMFEAIAPEKIKVAGKALGADGNAYIALANNQKVDVTPKAPEKYYSFNVGATKHELVISANGSELKPNQIPPEFCVGQKVTFTAVFNPPVNYSNILARWVLPEKYVNEEWQESQVTPDGYQVPYGSINYRKDSELLERLTTSCWFVNGIGGSINFGANLQFSNSQQIVMIRKRKIAISRPTVVMVDSALHDTPKIQWLEEWNAFHHGRIGVGSSPLNENISFEVRITSPKCGGEGHIVQLCDISDFSGITLGICCDGLDNEYPYPDTAVSIYKNEYPQGHINVIDLNDSPQAPGYSSIKMNGKFVDYVMFRPSFPNSIFVTLGKIVWNTSAAASYPSAVIIPNAITGPTQPDNSDEFPEWICIVRNPN